jgi:uncharacterized protein (DUF1778 family)
MSKRLQVILSEDEYRAIRRAAREQRTSVSAWVRDALRDARRTAPSATAADKLRVVRAAVRHTFPTADVDQMLDEIERGYGNAS